MKYLGSLDPRWGNANYESMVVPDCRKYFRSCQYHSVPFWRSIESFFGCKRWHGVMPSCVALDCIAATMGDIISATPT